MDLFSLGMHIISMPTSGRALPSTVARLAFTSGDLIIIKPMEGFGLAYALKTLIFFSIKPKKRRIL